MPPNCNHHNVWITTTTGDGKRVMTWMQHRLQHTPDRNQRPQSEGIASGHGAADPECPEHGGQNSGSEDHDLAIAAQKQAGGWHRPPTDETRFTAQRGRHQHKYIFHGHRNPNRDTPRNPVPVTPREIHHHTIQRNDGHRHHYIKRGEQWMHTGACQQLRQPVRAQSQENQLQNEARRPPTPRGPARAGAPSPAAGSADSAAKDPARRGQYRCGRADRAPCSGNFARRSRRCCGRRRYAPRLAPEEAGTAIRGRRVPSRLPP